LLTVVFWFNHVGNFFHGVTWLSLVKFERGLVG